MTLANFGTIAEIISAVAVLVTLGYLALQTRHANRLAQLQTRSHMVEMARVELTAICEDPELIALFSKPAPLAFNEAMKVHFFFILVMRQREWEWYQAHSGAIARSDADQVKRDCLEVAATYLSHRRLRAWWNGAGSYGFNPQFIAELEKYVESRPPVRIDLNFLAAEAALEEEEKALAKAPAADPK